MKKFYLSVMFLFLFSILSAVNVTPANDGENHYYFHFTKEGTDNIYFFDSDIGANLPKPAPSNVFSFPIVSKPTAVVSFDLGIYYEVYVQNFRLSVSFSSSAYGVKEDGYMLSSVLPDSKGEYTGMNYSVVNSNKNTSSVVVSDSIQLSEYDELISNKMPYYNGGAGDRTIVLIDNKNTEVSSSNGKIYLTLTMKPPTEKGYVAGQYTGNIYLVLDIY